MATDLSVDPSVLVRSDSGRAPRSVFLVTVFAGSFLLFQVQPMVARMALPDLGGAPAVWNSAMLVYQALLLAGYGWAHWLSRFAVRRQVAAHLTLLVVACLWLPVGLVGWRPPTGGSVVLFVPALLLLSVGPLLLAVSAQAPLVQRWFAASGGVNPYPLYAASNLGSFLGLLAYPLVVEPTLRLDSQRWGWTAGYAVLVLLVLACGSLTIRAARGSSAARPLLQARSAPIARRRVVGWLALSFVPSGLMLSTTTHLSTDIMAMPLLWAIPLGLYLLSFTVAFSSRRRPARIVGRCAPALLLLAGATALVSGGTAGYGGVALSLVTLFAVAVALHSRLYDGRPAPEQLTTFYLVTAVGGGLGGVFCGLLAPVVFDWVYEHPVLVVAAGCLLPLRAVSARFDVAALAPSRAWVAQGAAVGLVAALSVVVALTGETVELVLMLCLVAVGVLAGPWRSVYVAVLVGLMCSLGAASTVAPSLNGDRVRSYFGVYTVVHDDEPRSTVLVHGVTVHGVQLTSPGLEDEPTTYYGADSGVGLVLGHAEEVFGPDASVGVVGLGAGTLACYHRPGQAWQFFEIDPAIVHIARDSGRFSFLADCAPDATVTVGDARLELEAVPDRAFDVLAVDAFSSDAIPMHLMTREAFDTYARVVAADGLVLVHITNRFIDLEPVLRGLTTHGWSAAVHDGRPSDHDAAVHASVPSTWVALSRTATVLDRRLAAAGGDWRPLSAARGVQDWTDDFASVLPLLK